MFSESLQQGFSKNIWHATILGCHQIVGCVGRQPKKFIHHLTHPHDKMEIELFWSLERAWGGRGDDLFFRNDTTCAPLFWWLKIFSCHLTYPHYKMATEFFCSLKGVEAYAIILGIFFILYFPSWSIEEFRSPFNYVGVSNVDQNSSAAIQHNFIIQWQLKKICRHKRGWLIFFSCPSLWHLKFSITIRGQLKSFNCPSLGYWIFSISILYPTLKAIEKI